MTFALSFSCGVIATLAFRALSGTFATDLTLAGVDLGPEFVATLVGATLVVLTFAGTLTAGLRLTGPRRRVPGLLWVSVVMQGVVLAAWITTAGTAAGLRLLVIALSAAALGLQAAGARCITDRMADGVHEPADRRDSETWTRIGSIPTLVAGAATGIAVVAAAPATAPLISSAAVIAAVFLVRRSDLHRW